MTEYQKKIFKYTLENKQITKIKAVELIGNRYYCNASKHVGDVLSRMVNLGLLKRVKNGLFECGNKTNKNHQPENQLNLF